MCGEEKYAHGKSFDGVKPSRCNKNVVRKTYKLQSYPNFSHFKNYIYMSN